MGVLNVYRLGQADGIIGLIGITVHDEFALYMVPEGELGQRIAIGPIREYPVRQHGLGRQLCFGLGYGSLLAHNPRLRGGNWAFEELAPVALARGEGIIAPMPPYLRAVFSARSPVAQLDCPPAFIDALSQYVITVDAQRVAAEAIASQMEDTLGGRNLDAIVSAAYPPQ